MDASTSSSSDPSTCAQHVGSLRVPYNTRSYFLSGEPSSACEGKPFHHHDYSCVSYSDGAIYLSGKVLSYDVDLSGIGCGCNAALYLVSMPQNTNATTCHDFYCDANDVCGREEGRVTLEQYAH